MSSRKQYDWSKVTSRFRIKNLAVCSSLQKMELGKACERNKSTQDNFIQAVSACPARIHMAPFPEEIYPSHCVFVIPIRARGDYKHPKGHYYMEQAYLSAWFWKCSCVHLYKYPHTNEQVGNFLYVYYSRWVNAKSCMWKWTQAPITCSLARPPQTHKKSKCYTFL